MTKVEKYVPTQEDNQVIDTYANEDLLKSFEKSYGGINTGFTDLHDSNRFFWKQHLDFIYDVYAQKKPIDKASIVQRLKGHKENLQYTNKDAIDKISKNVSNLFITVKLLDKIIGIDTETTGVLFKIAELQKGNNYKSTKLRESFINTCQMAITSLGFKENLAYLKLDKNDRSKIKPLHLIQERITELNELRQTKETIKPIHELEAEISTLGEALRYGVAVLLIKTKEAKCSSESVELYEKFVKIVNEKKPNAKKELENEKIAKKAVEETLSQTMAEKDKALADSIEKDKALADSLSENEKLKAQLAMYMNQTQAQQIETSITLAA